VRLCEQIRKVHEREPFERSLAFGSDTSCPHTPSQAGIEGDHEAPQSGPTGPGGGFREAHRNRAIYRLGGDGSEGQEASRSEEEGHPCIEWGVGDEQAATLSIRHGKPRWRHHQDVENR
jgi:hypothetical protein